MIERAKELWKKYEETIAYLIVGVLTTLFSWGVMFSVNWLAFGNPLCPTIVQNVVLSVSNWTSGVIFAYFTNRRFVFKSHAPMLKEIPKFVTSRIATLVLELVMRQILGLMKVNVYVITGIVGVLVVVVNYVFSKLLVFTKKPSAP